MQCRLQSDHQDNDKKIKRLGSLSGNPPPSMGVPVKSTFSMYWIGFPQNWRVGGLSSLTWPKANSSTIGAHGSHPFALTPCKLYSFLWGYVTKLTNWFVNSFGKEQMIEIGSISLKHGHGYLVECPCVGHVDTHRTRVEYVSNTPHGISLTK